MEFSIINGMFEINPNMDGWTITSESATVEGAEDAPLYRGDTITASGDVIRDGVVVANIK